jgi:hypothetical protein
VVDAALVKSGKTATSIGQNRLKRSKPSWPIQTHPSQQQSADNSNFHIQLETNPQPVWPPFSFNYTHSIYNRPDQGTPYHAHRFLSCNRIWVRSEELTGLSHCRSCLV